MSAFTPVAHPGRVGGASPRCHPADAAKGTAALSALDAKAIASGPVARAATSGPAVKAIAAPLRAGAAASSASASAAHDSLSGSDSPSTLVSSESLRADEDEWHEKLRLSQEVLTLLRHILTDKLLGDFASTLMTCLAQAGTATVMCLS